MSSDPGLRPDPDIPLFESYFRVRFHEVDALGHVNNATYLNYLEQAAIDHATFVGLDLPRLRELGGLFVARRHDIVFLRPSYAGDLLRVVTWLGEPRGARVDRRYLVAREVRDAATDDLIARRLIEASQVPDQDSLVVQATTEWVFTNNLGRPRRLPAEVVRIFATIGAPDGDSTAGDQ